MWDKMDWVSCKSAPTCNQQIWIPFDRSLNVSQKGQRVKIKAEILESVERTFVVFAEEDYSC